MTRLYVFEVLFWPRDEKNEPVFPAEERESPSEHLRLIALKRGLTHPEASRWAAKEVARLMPKGQKSG